MNHISTNLLLTKNGFACYCRADNYAILALSAKRSINLDGLNKTILKMNFLIFICIVCSICTTQLIYADESSAMKYQGLGYSKYDIQHLKLRFYMVL